LIELGSNEELHKTHKNNKINNQQREMQRKFRSNRIPTDTNAKFGFKPKRKRIFVFLVAFSSISSVLLFMAASSLFAGSRHFDSVLYQAVETSKITHVDLPLAATSSSSCYPKMGLIPLKHRDQLGDLAEKHGLKSGIEIGVKEGDFARTMLSNWKSCEKYHLVDLWAQQTNYKDVANVNNAVQEDFYQRAKTVLGEHKHKTEFHRMLSTEASKKFEKESIDFIYVDARHDYCGVKEDLEHYWPILKPGGIMAGHDYMENSEVRNQDWGLCEDGTRNEMAVKGAVNDFFVPKGLTISVTYIKRRQKSTWMVQKPLC
jgi:hypothetical protein